MQKGKKKDEGFTTTRISDKNLEYLDSISRKHDSYDDLVTKLIVSYLKHEGKQVEQ
jgi:hypothetical protein